MTLFAPTEAELLNRKPIIVLEFVGRVYLMKLMVLL